tara:strand:- start:11865 stop:13502 length:1638 start_codon:yes stop_codon:yes gene_type:complete
MSAVIEIDYFNTFIVKGSYSGAATNAGNTVFLSPGIAYPGGINTSDNTGIYIEESRIKGDFNGVSYGAGVKAFLDDPRPLQQKRINTLIYSGIYNSRTGVNDTNVFSTGTDITRSCDPANGSIQKTYAEDTNLIVFQENKVSRALIDKDTIYTTEGGTQTQAGAKVIGQIVPYKGEYGISKNPESFAVYSYRKYFADKYRNAVIRLSNDGITEISSYGMMDYFRDEFAEINDESTIYNISISKDGLGSNGDFVVEATGSEINKVTLGMQIENQDGYITFIQELSSTKIRIFYSKAFTIDIPSTFNVKYKTRGKIIGGWDIHSKNYVISLQKNSNQVSTTTDYNTLAFEEQIKGWVSFFNYKPNLMFSVQNKFLTFQNASLYKHYSTVANTRGNFYGVNYASSITTVFNEQPSLVKNFKTVGYEGSSGWEVETFISDITGVNVLPNTNYNNHQDSTSSVKSYEEGLYTDTVTGQPLRAGFNRKENIYVANLISTSPAMPGEISFGGNVTGIKGFIATVKFKTDGTTQLGGEKELWSVRSEYVNSSY